MRAVSPGVWVFVACALVAGCDDRAGEPGDDRGVAARDGDAPDRGAADAGGVDGSPDAAPRDAAVDARAVDAGRPADGEVSGDGAAPDARALTVRVFAPAAGAFVRVSPVVVSGVVSSGGAAVEIDGRAAVVDDRGRFSAEVPLSEGPNAIEVTARDGRETASVAIDLVLDTRPPVLTIAAPGEGASVSGQRLEIDGTVDEDEVTVTVDGVAAVVAQRRFAHPVRLREGPNRFSITARDRAGNEATRALDVIGDSAPPALGLTEPEDGSTTALAEIDVRGTVEAGARVSVGAVDARVEGGLFSARVPLDEGANRVVVRAVDAAGNAAEASVGVLRDSRPPVIRVLEPAPGAVVAAERVAMRGTVDDRAARLTVDGAPVRVGPDATWSHEAPLAEGPNRLLVVALDGVDNRAEASVDVVRDTRPPRLEVEHPADGARVGDPSVEVRGSVDDAAARVTVDGIEAEVVQGRFARVVQLEPGARSIVVEAVDPVGNRAALTVRVERDVTAPVLAIVEPADGAVTGADGIEVVGTVDDPQAAVDVGGAPVEVVEGRFVGAVALVDGENRIVVRARDDVGNVSEVALTVVRDAVAPRLTIDVPRDGARLNRRRIRASGLIDDPRSTVRAGDALAVIEGGRWVADVDLDEGPVTLVVSAEDTAGNRREVEVSVVVDSVPPVVEIHAPEDDLDTRAEAVSVRGRALGPDIREVEVDGVAVDVGPDGAFERPDVPIESGLNVISVAATDDFGNVGLARVEVVRDADPPRLHVESPLDGAVVTGTQIDVSGVVQDYIRGITIGEDDLQVWVDGREARVINRTFNVSGVLLQRGRNIVSIEAEDRVGNRTSVAIEVVAQPVSGQRVMLVGGNEQEGVARAALPEPLVATLLDRAGAPVAGAPVRFEVVRGDGQLDAFPQAGRAVIVETDATGLAAVGFTLGQRAGAGNHRVRATADGFVGAAEFVATALPGPADRVLAVEGENQMGAVGQALVEPLTAYVTDAAGNPVTGADVVFTVTRGGGRLSDGEQLVVSTDGDGLARAHVVLGPDAGAQAVLATLGPPAAPAVSGSASALFRIRAFEPGPRASTRVVGQVLDNEDGPIPGVTAWIRIDGGPIVSGVTDARGQFAIADAPIGEVHLVIEGETATREGPWPRLTYDIVTVPGVDNELDRPIYLPRIRPDGVRIVGGPEDVTLEMAGVGGATVTVFANSVTCLDGARTCPLSWSQVRGARVPGPLPTAAPAEMVATLQPPGVRFDPPARVCLPNRSNPPGYQQDLFAYDHDLGDWIGLGTGTVTPNGEQICSDMGFGIHKSGWWGAVPPPPPSECASDCSSRDPCKLGSCSDGQCVYEPVPDDTRCDDGSGCGLSLCIGGSCAPIHQNDDGAPCDDLDACTESSECVGGACVGTELDDCDDENPCTDDSCDPAQGCQNRPLGEGDACQPGAEGEGCAEAYECRQGACVPTGEECEQDDNPCTINTCTAGDCVEEKAEDGRPCGDENECGPYACRDGRCEPSEDGEDTEGQECDDRSECTEDDVCRAGVCKGEPRDTEKIEAQTKFDFLSTLDRYVERVETLVNRVPFLDARFLTGGLFGLSAFEEDCCRTTDGAGVFVEKGKTAYQATAAITAEVFGTLPGLGLIQRYEESIGDRQVEFVILVGVIADLSLAVKTEAKHVEDTCNDGAPCTEIDGILEVGGGLRATAQIEACFEFGLADALVCSGINVTPARLVLLMQGQGGWRSGDCATPGVEWTVKVGELKLVMEVGYVIGTFVYERVLYGGL